LLGGTAAVLPFVGRAHAQKPPMPTVGFLDARSPEALADRLRGFRQGLAEMGYVEGDNTTVLYRWGENNSDRLPELAADLVRRQVTALVAGGGTAAVFAAKAATTTIPVIFLVGDDPVRLGLVTSLARPSGNLTGINFFNTELVAKQLGLLHELVPQAARVAIFINPANVSNAEALEREVKPAARDIGLQVQIVGARTSREIDAAFATLARDRPDAIFVGSDGLFNGRRVQLVHQASHHRLPAIYSGREYCDVGGLMSYGTNIADAYRQAGVYAGRVLKGAKAADLPVVQSTKFELVINHQTARILGLVVPQSLLVVADELIE